MNITGAFIGKKITIDWDSDCGATGVYIFSVVFLSEEEIAIVYKDKNPPLAYFIPVENDGGATYPILVTSTKDPIIVAHECVHVLIDFFRRTFTDIDWNKFFEKEKKVEGVMPKNCAEEAFAYAHTEIMGKVMEALEEE